MKFCPKCKCKVTASGGGTDICSKGHEFPSIEVIEGEEAYIATYKSGVKKSYAKEAINAGRYRVDGMKKSDGNIDVDDLMMVAYLMGLSDAASKMTGDGDFVTGMEKVILECEALN